MFVLFCVAVLHGGPYLLPGCADELHLNLGRYLMAASDLCNKICSRGVDLSATVHCGNLDANVHVSTRSRSAQSAYN